MIAGEDGIRLLQVNAQPGWRGGERQLVQLIEGLAREGIDCRLACRAGSELERWARQTGQRYRSFPFGRLPERRTAIALCTMVREERIDLVHAHDARGHAAVHLACRRGLAAPLLLSRRVARPIRRSLPGLGKYQGPELRAVACVSEFVRQVNRERLRPQTRLVVIHDGIDPRPYANAEGGRLRRLLRLAPEARLIGNSAALTREKGHDRFLDVLGTLAANRPDLHGVLIGTGKLERYLRRRIAAEGLESRVHLLGQRDDLPQLLCDLDLFLFPSRREGLGSALLEAFAAGVPVVASRVGGIPELVVDGRTGLLVDPDDPSAMARRVARLLDDHDLAGRLIDGARRHLDSFRIERTVLRTSELYHELLRSPPESNGHDRRETRRSAPRPPRPSRHS